MGETIAVMNQKGGCGKTTTVVNLATSLAALGKAVLVVDMDPQANATTSFGINKIEIKKTVYTALVNECSVQKATVPTKIENLFILPSNIDLSGIEVELSKEENYHIALKNLLKDIFDYIIIDLPPSLGVITINSLIAADSVLVPIQAEYFALEGLADLMNTIKLVETRLRSPTPIKGILLTLYDARTILGREVYAELKKYFKDKEYVFKTVIPRNIKLAEAPSYGKPCIVYDPESKGAIAYFKLAQEMIKMDEEN